MPSRKSRSFLLDTARRVVPQRYRRLIPAWVKRAAGYVVAIEIAYIDLLILFFLRRFPRHRRMLRHQMETHSRDEWLTLLIKRDFASARKALFDSEYDKCRFYLSRVINRSLSYAKATDYLAESYYLRGHAHVIMSNNEAAIGDLRMAIDKGYDSADAHFYLAHAYSNLEENDAAITHYKTALQLAPDWAQAMINLAHLDLLEGEEEAAVELLRKAIGIDPAFSMPHQNVAALYNRAKYKPSPLDLQARREFMLYDAYNYTGERTFHVGVGTKAARLWGNALTIQRQIEKEFTFPAKLNQIVTKKFKLDPNLPVRILPYEWVTQIGHIAMLDTYLKIQALGWRPQANLLLLAPRQKVSNHAYLKAWRQQFHVVSDGKLVEALFPYQRFIGDCFNAFLHDNGNVEFWPDVGARAHIAWDQQKREPLLALSALELERGRAKLASLGMPRNAWFVCLHAREGGYHREGGGSIQTHRNASILDYLPAIQEIVRRGGWVVRMGDASMSPLPPMHGVIDYPHTAAKSDWMDVFLSGACRFFIGTTSGLTNAVISFGVPCLLVNCLSNFSQLWNNRVLFTLKPFWAAQENRYLRLDELVTEPIRSKVFNIRALSSAGITPCNNTSDEILENVIEMLTRLEDGTLGAEQSTPGMLAWNEVMSRNNMFGNGRPSNVFLERNFETLFRRQPACG